MTETDEMTVTMQIQTGVSNVLKDSKDGMNVTRERHSEERSKQNS